MIRHTALFVWAAGTNDEQKVRVLHSVRAQARQVA